MFENVWIQDMHRRREVLAGAAVRHGRAERGVERGALAFAAGVVLGVTWGIPGLFVVAGAAAVLALRGAARRRRRPLSPVLVARKEAFAWNSAPICR